MKNPVKRSMDRLCKPFVVPSKRQDLRDIAEYRESLKSVSDAEINTKMVVMPTSTPDNNKGEE